MQQFSLLAMICWRPPQVDLHLPRRCRQNRVGWLNGVWLKGRVSSSRIYFGCERVEKRVLGMYLSMYIRTYVDGERGGGLAQPLAVHTGGLLCVVIAIHCSAKIMLCFACPLPFAAPARIFAVCGVCVWYLIGPHSSHPSDAASCCGVTKYFVMIEPCRAGYLPSAASRHPAFVKFVLFTSQAHTSVSRAKRAEKTRLLLLPLHYMYKST